MITSERPVRRKVGLCKVPDVNAFSLVEVVIAIGIISVAILAIISLLSVGLRGSRESSDDTHLALMTQYINARNRSQSFSDLKTPSNNITVNPAPTFYFNAAGEVARNASGDPVPAAAPDSHYACTVSWQTSAVSSNLILLQYRFEWPLSAPTNGRQQRVITTSRANEE